MKYRAAMLAALVGALANAPLQAREPEISGMALQQIQAKDFETQASIAFPAVMTVLQDSGYRIMSADRDTGLITAIGSSSGKLIWAPFVGFRQKKKVPQVSAFIEQRGPNYARVRLTFVMSTGKSDRAFTDEKPVTDPEPYRDAFEKIEKEIFVRQAMNAPAPVASAPATAQPIAVQSGPGLVAAPKSTPTAATPAPSSATFQAPSGSSRIRCDTCQ